MSERSQRRFGPSRCACAKHNGGAYCFSDRRRLWRAGVLFWYQIHRTHIYVARKTIGDIRAASTLNSRGTDLEPWLRNAEINRDRGLRLQYLAGLALDLQASYDIYGSIVFYRRYPRDLFQVSPLDEAALLRGY